MVHLQIAAVRSPGVIPTPDGEPFTAAAATMVSAAVNTLGAEGAAILLHLRGQAGTLVATAGDLPSIARPFMLADGDDAVWVRQRFPTDDGCRLEFVARFPHTLSAAEHGAVALLSPGLHALAGALALQRTTAARMAGLESALHRSELAILLVDRDATLLFANSAAEQLLDRADALRRKGDGISARDLGEAIKLQVAIEHVCAGEGTSSDDPVVVLKRRHPGRSCLVSVSPMHVRDGEIVGAILRVIDPDRDIQAALEPVCALYRLSPVETRLACQLARGATVEAASETLRIKAQTARSYLKQIFLKTDTNRQTELVGMLLTSTVRARPAGRFRIV